jgi:chromosomal replication initiation ATPase DnaA
MNRDHSTVMYGVERAGYMMERDADYADKVNRLIEFQPQSEELEDG